MERNVIEYLHKRFNKDDSQVSPVRCRGFKRHNLIKLFSELEYKKGAEVGVAEGDFSEYICKTINDGHLYSIDSWGSELNEDPRGKLIGLNLAKSRYKEAKEKLSKYNCSIIKDISMSAVLAITKESLDYVYIDGNHTFDFIMQDLIEWGKRVRSNGIISGHDYYHFRWSGVVEAVEIYTKMHKIYEWYITDERTPSFFWGKSK